MKSLENRTYDSKREMDILDALEEVRHINKRLAKVDYQELLIKTIAKYEDKELINKDDIKQDFKDKVKNKNKLIDEDEPYEDGENFDQYVGFKNIVNPFDLLNMDNNDNLSDSSSGSNKEEQKEVITSNKNFNKSNNIWKNGLLNLGLKKRKFESNEEMEKNKLTTNKIVK